MRISGFFFVFGVSVRPCRVETKPWCIIIIKQIYYLNPVIHLLRAEKHWPESTARRACKYLLAV